ncbi:MAG: methyltransferase [Myxococcaceae bacterium]|nr:methyltransferase [Myxococcaceae bacterium]
MTDPPIAEAILRGLRARPKTLPTFLLYDALGSALFEAITELPEYGLTRADLRVIEAHRADVVRALPGPLDVVELGPGGGRKAALFLRAVTAVQARTVFTAIDVSASALRECQRALEQLDGVEVRSVEATYLDGLRRAGRVEGARRLVLFLGSNLSNFDRRDALAFLRDVRATLSPGDALLLATDLEKPAAELLPAYDDALGVTAAFNRNLLVRLNREHGADFPIADFAHEARWNAPERRIEMHLVARRACEVRLLGAAVSFAAGESIWTESSHRFRVDELRAWADESGYTCAEQWTDQRWPFAHSLFLAR